MDRAIARYMHDGVVVLVTSDCGTTSHREIEAANKLGIDVLVTDHHQRRSHLPGVCA